MLFFKLLLLLYNIYIVNNNLLVNFFIKFMKKFLTLLTCFLLSIAWANAQSNTSGTVVDGGGEPIIGASVLVKGSSAGTVTDVNGHFSVNVPAGSNTLVISYIGMITKEVAAGSSLNVILQSSSKSLDEVVVTGLGIKKSQKGLGYSVSKVKAEDVVKSGETNIIESLAAKATGVQVTASSGTPGASSKIILRGPASFTGDNQPLIVVDGVPIDNKVNTVQAGDDPYNGTLAGVQLSNRAIDLNPEDIESVSILKGPAAAAIYGQAAGNGAIIYTTKRGGAKKGLGITYSSSLEIQNVSKLPDLQSRYGQGEGGVYKSSTASSWGPDLYASGKPIYDNVDNFFETGLTFVNNLSISGGNNDTSFRASINATNMTGIIPETELEKYSARLTGDTKLSKWLTVGGTVNYTATKSKMAQNGSNLSGVMLSLLRMPSDFDARDYIDPKTDEQITYYAYYDNPFFSSKMNPYTEENDRILGNLYADATINEMFGFSLKVGVDSYQTNGKQIYAYSSNGNDYGDGTGQVNKTGLSFRNLYADLLLKFKKSFGEENEFTLNGLLGANYNYTQRLKSFQRGRIMAIPGFYGFSGMSELYASDDDEYQENKAIFADASFDYKSIVFLTLTGRGEWSSTFGKGANGFFYPKADVSYIFSHLLPDDFILSYGKIRLAYANVGISPLTYTDRTYFEVPFVADGYTNGLSFPYDNQPGYAISNELKNGDLKPERNIGKEIGLELIFFKGRLNIDATYYNQTSKDLLIHQPIAPSSGFQYKYVNIGEVRNTGIELGINGDIIKKSNFTWNMAVNWSKNNNEVLKLAPNVDKITVGSGFVTPQSYAIVGQPFGVLFGTKFQRDDNGNLLINPNNGLPMAEPEEQKIGNPLPNWLMNINNGFTYKDFSFSFLFDIRKGGDIWNGTWSSLNNRGKSAESGNRERMYVIPGVYASGIDAGQANTTEIDAYTYYGSNYLGKSGSENDIQDGSWIRLRSVNFSYKFNFARKNPSAVVQYLEIGAALKNMLLFTDYKGVDPETSLTGASQNLSGYDYFNNPGTKSVLFNIRLGL